MSKLTHKIFAIGLLSTTIVLAGCGDNTDTTTITDQTITGSNVITGTTNTGTINTGATGNTSPNPNPSTVTGDIDGDGIIDIYTGDNMTGSGMGSTGQGLTGNGVGTGMNGMTGTNAATGTNRTNTGNNQTGFNRQTSYDVNIQGFKFEPQVLRVKRGDIVTWTNQDTVGHTATTTSVPANSRGFDSGMLQKGQSYSYTFNQTGTFNYFCTPHPRMTGEIIVE